MNFIPLKKKLLFRVLGSIIVLGTIISFFWTNNEGVAEGEKRSSTEGSYTSSSTTSLQHKSVKPSPSVYMESYKSKQEEQLRVFMIVFLVVGSGFLIYSFVKKEDDSKKE